MDGMRTDVTSAHEPSYYEIALTNRQVVVAFVILLVCLLSAFFSGMWIGRESSARAAEQIASNPTPAQSQEGQSLEEFEFFEKPQGKAQDTPAEPEPPPQEDTTLLEDFGGDPDASASDEADEEDAEEPEIEEPTPAPQRPAAQPRQRPAAEEQSEVQQPRRDESVVRSRPLPEAPRTAPAAAADRGGVVIQVFSSSEQEQAARIQARLSRGGHKAFLSPVQVAGRTMYRVRIGPFNSRDEAQKVAEQVRKGYKLDTWVTE